MWPTADVFSLKNIVIFKQKLKMIKLIMIKTTNTRGSVFKQKNPS